MTYFYRNLTFAQAREYLKFYTVEEVRQLIEEGAFGERMNEPLKAYLQKRIADPEFC